MIKRLILLLGVTSSLYAAAPKPYHLELIANPAAPFPFLSKFGTVTLHVFPAGVRAETFWLNGFTRNGARTITVENPLGRMYTDVPVTQISAILHELSSSGVEQVAPDSITTVNGTVKGIAARRYRLAYGPQAWIDVWTTDTIPENPQLRAVITEFVHGVSPATAKAMGSIPGMPLYVELNFRRYKKVPLLRLKNFAWNGEGEEDALRTGTLYFKAPLLDAIWK
ncbi:MAG: hypothetical protein QOK37_4471 [Thermoanaerobaculia bacterium]|jgi:hypothetical protein|nr:hypothetical protein [Thermoanaerobaculia bacterium]